MHFEWMLATANVDDDILIEYDQMYEFPHTIFDFLEPWPTWKDIQGVPHTVSVFIKIEDVEYRIWETHTRSAFRARWQHTHGRNIVRGSRGGVLTGFKKAKLHKRGVDQRRDFLQKVKRALAVLKLPKGGFRSVYDGHVPFERGCVDWLDQMRMAQIKAMAVDDNDVQNDEPDSVYEDAVAQLSGLDIVREITAVEEPMPKAAASTFTLSGLLSEMNLNRKPATSDTISFGARAASSTQWNRYHSLIVPALMQMPTPMSEQTAEESPLQQQEPVTSSNLMQPHKSNIFYKPGFTLAQAAVRIVDILRGARRGCDSWLSIPGEQFKKSQKKSAAGLMQLDPLTRMCGDLNQVRQLLVIGREGWELTRLPDEFFNDALLATPLLPMKLKELSEREGLEWLQSKAVVPAEEIEKMLESIKKRRDQMSPASRANAVKYTRVPRWAERSVLDGRSVSQVELVAREAEMH